MSENRPNPSPSAGKDEDAQDADKPSQRQQEASSNEAKKTRKSFSHGKQSLTSQKRSNETKLSSDDAQSALPGSKELNDLCKAYIPTVKDIRKELAKKEVTKLTQTTYGRVKGKSVPPGSPKHITSPTSSATAAHKTASPTDKMQAKQLLAEKRSSKKFKVPLVKEAQLDELLNQRAKGRTRIEQMIHKQEDVDLVEAKHIAHLRKLSKSTAGILKKKSSHDTTTRYGEKVTSKTLSREYHKKAPQSTGRRVSKRLSHPSNSPSIDQQSSNRYKPNSSFNMSDRWSNLRELKSASTTTSSLLAHSSLASLAHKTSPPLPSVAQSVSLATTIDDMPMDSDHGSLAPPNSSNTSISKNTSEEPFVAKSKDQQVESEAILQPSLKYQQGKNDFVLSYSKSPSKSTTSHLVKNPSKLQSSKHVTLSDDVKHVTLSDDVKPVLSPPRSPESFNSFTPDPTPSGSPDLTYPDFSEQQNTVSPMEPSSCASLEYTPSAQDDASDSQKHVYSSLEHTLASSSHSLSSHAPSSKHSPFPEQTPLPEQTPSPEQTPLPEQTLLTEHASSTRQAVLPPKQALESSVDTSTLSETLPVSLKHSTSHSNTSEISLKHKLVSLDHLPTKSASGSLEQNSVESPEHKQVSKTPHSYVTHHIPTSTDHALSSLENFPESLHPSHVSPEPTLDSPEVISHFSPDQYLGSQEFISDPTKHSLQHSLPSSAKDHAPATTKQTVTTKQTYKPDSTLASTYDQHVFSESTSTILPEQSLLNNATLVSTDPAQPVMPEHAPHTLQTQSPTTIPNENVSPDLATPPDLLEHHSLQPDSLNASTSLMSNLHSLHRSPEELEPVPADNVLLEPDSHVLIEETVGSDISTPTITQTPLASTLEIKESLGTAVSGKPLSHTQHSLDNLQHPPPATPMSDHGSHISPSPPSPELNSAIPHPIPPKGARSYRIPSSPPSPEPDSIIPPPIPPKKFVLSSINSVSSDTEISNISQPDLPLNNSIGQNESRGTQAGIDVDRSTVIVNEQGITNQYHENTEKVLSTADKELEILEFRQEEKPYRRVTTDSTTNTDDQNNQLFDEDSVEKVFVQTNRLLSNKESGENHKHASSIKHYGEDERHSGRKHFGSKQRSVKFSHSMVVGGTSQNEINDLTIDLNDDDGDDVVNVTDARSFSASPRASALLSDRKNRKYSIETTNDPIGYGMSSFLSARDSVEVALKKASKSITNIDSQENIQSHLSKLITEINAGKLGESEVTQLTNFAQKLLHAHSAGEVIGHHATNYDSVAVETLIDNTPAPDTPNILSCGNKSVTDSVNCLISEIHQNNLTPVHMTDLALAIVEACSKSTKKLKKNLKSQSPSQSRKYSEALLTPCQSVLKGNSPKSTHRRTLSGERGTCRVKWSEESDTQQLVRILRKLKTQMILAPNGGSFTESIDKVIKDIDEQQHPKYFYDAMLLILCTIVTYQAWQSEQGVDPDVDDSQRVVVTKFDVLAIEIVVSALQHVISGMQKDEYSTEELLRLTSLVASCNFSKAQNLPEEKVSVQPEPRFKVQEDIVLNAMRLMKRLMLENAVSVNDLNSLAFAAYRLQSKTTTGEPLQEAQSIWATRKSSSRLVTVWSLQPFLTADEASNNDDIEISFLTHLRLKLGGLQEAFGFIELLTTSLKITESALDVLAQNSEHTSFWAASLVLVVALLFDQIKSDFYTGSLDYKILDSLVNNAVYEAFSVSIVELQKSHISLATFQYLTSAVSKYRVQGSSPLSFGLSPTFLGKSFAANSVSSPYTIIDFLEKSMQFMRGSVRPQAIEVKALGDYVLSLQHFYGSEMMSRLGVKEQYVNIKHWPNKSFDDDTRGSHVITVEMILDHIDEAVEMSRQLEPSDSNLLYLACFVIYLVEAPEKLARNEHLTLPPSSCSLQEYEHRLSNVHKISHLIPRFDFVIKNLEKARYDLKNHHTFSYNRDMILLSLCVFVVFEWIRCEPLTVFAAAKLESRASSVIHDAVQSTLHGIKAGELTMEDLQNLTGIISNTADLRRASAVNVSIGDSMSEPRAEKEDSTEKLYDEAVVLDLVEKLVLRRNSDSNYLDADKLYQVLASVQNGAISSHLYELLVLSICTAASQQAIDLSRETDKSSNARRPRMSSSAMEAQECAVETIRQAVDGLRSGCIDHTELHSLVDMFVRRTEGNIVDRDQLKDAVNRMTCNEDKFRQFQKCQNVPQFQKCQNVPTVDINKVRDILVQPSSRKDRDAFQEVTETKRANNHFPSQSGQTSRISISSQDKLSRRTFLLKELCKDAMSRLVHYVDAGLFTNAQLQCLSDIIYRLDSYQESHEAFGTDAAEVEKILNQVLTTTKIIVNDPKLAHKVLNSEMLCQSLFVSQGQGQENSFAMDKKPVMARKKDRTELKSALTIVVNGLESGQYTKEEMDMLSHSVNKALDVKEPLSEPVKEVELHGMMGKRPLHVSSEFLGETLSAISIRPDGLKRYSYKSLINPDLTKVEGVVGVPEREMGPRLRKMSGAHLSSVGMAPFPEEERERRRSSLPSRDFYLQGIPDPVDEMEEEEDVWEASMHEINVTDSVNFRDFPNAATLPNVMDKKSPKSNKNNSSRLDATDSDQSVDLKAVMDQSYGEELKTNSPDQSIDSQLTSDQSSLSKEVSASVEEQQNNNANVKATPSSHLVEISSEITKTPPSLSESDNNKQICEEPIDDRNVNRHQIDGECLDVYRKQSMSGTDSQSSMCPIDQVGEGDSFHSLLTTQKKNISYPKPHKTGGARVVKKVQRPKADSSRKVARGQMVEEKTEVRNLQSVAELANSYAKAMSRQVGHGTSTRSKGKTAAKSAITKKSSTSKAIDAVLSAYSVGKKSVKK